MIAEEFPGVPNRLRAAWHARGFWHLDRNSPQIARFCRRYPGYDPQIVGQWLKADSNRRPSYANLQRLANDLNWSALYLLHGRRILDDPEWSRLVAIREAILKREQEEEAEARGHVPPDHPKGYITSLSNSA